MACPISQGGHNNQVATGKALMQYSSEKMPSPCFARYCKSIS